MHVYKIYFIHLLLDFGLFLRVHSDACLLNKHFVRSTTDQLSIASFIISLHNIFSHYSIGQFRLEKELICDLIIMRISELINSIRV